MAGNSRRCNKKKPEIRSHDVEELIDRLSDLPDNIIDHILAFLDSISVVQTCLLSKRWRYLWKAVPSLNFYSSCFRKKSSFIEHVDKFLSLRCNSVAVGSITFDVGGDYRGRQRDIELFHSVMQCAAAAAHGGQLHHLSINLFAGQFNDIAASIAACDHHESLKILKLKGLDLLFSPGLSSLGFKLLTTLELDNCCLLSDLADALANPPACLKYLKLLDCKSPSRVKVSAPQLLELEIRNSNFRGGIEVSALQLKSFHLCDGMLALRMMPYKLNFPSLDHASICIWCKYPCYFKSIYFTPAYMNLLRGLHNVESLHLRFDKLGSGNAWVEWVKKHVYPFSRAKPLIESSGVSPFNRLKTLRVQYPRDPPSLPDEVIRYYFGSSSSAGEKSVEFEKID